MKNKHMSSQNIPIRVLRFDNMKKPKASALPFLSIYVLKSVSHGKCFLKSVFLCLKRENTFFGNYSKHCPSFLVTSLYLRGELISIIFEVVHTLT